MPALWGESQAVHELHDDHNEESKLDEVLGLLNGGRTLALISDAGLPLVPDPATGWYGPAARRGFPVSVVPGPSAPVTGCRERHRAAAVRVWGSFPAAAQSREKTLPPWPI